MVLMCTGDKPAFSKSTVDKSAKSLLTRMGAEDVFGDAPKAADWVCMDYIMLCKVAHFISLHMSMQSCT